MNRNPMIKLLGLGAYAVLAAACGGSEAEEPKASVSSGGELAPIAQTSSEAASTTGASASGAIASEQTATAPVSQPTAQSRQMTQMAQDEAAQAPVLPAQRDIIETVLAAPQFSTLVKAIQEAGLVETLKGPGPYTVFAPTDDAFAKLPEGKLESLLAPENKEKLIALLNHHVIPNELTSEQVATAKSAKTINGKTLRIRSKNDQLQVNNAKVTSSEIKASNGVVYVIDTVLVPKN
jgi:uncharacterized surface protein with fasciclin (FAS1) repeats